MTRYLRYIAPLLAVGLGACGEDPGAVLTRAKAEYARHDYTAARTDLIAALESRPGDRDLQLLLARTQLALGDGSGAGVTLEKLAGGRKPSGELAELAAEAALLRRSPAVALQLLGDLGTAEAERLRALAALQANDATRAQEHFAKAVALGGNTRTFADYARLRMLQGDAQGADEMLLRAQKLGADAIDTLLLGGDFAVRRGDLDGALQAFQSASRLYPSSTAALVGQAAVLGDLGRIKEMDRIVTVLSERVPDGLDVLYLRARSLYARQAWKDIRDLIQPRATEVPSAHPLRMIQAESLLRLGNPQQALTTLQPLARAQPGNRAAIMLMAQAQLDSGDAKAALQTLRPLADSAQARREELLLMTRIAKAANDGGAASYAARAERPLPAVLGGDLAEADAALRKGDWARARDAYNRILAVTNGRNPIVLNNMAMAQLMLGNGAKAREFARRALEIAPEDASILDTNGWVLLKTGGNREEALRLLAQAAQKSPDNATIARHLAEARAG